MGEIISQILSFLMDLGYLGIALGLMIEIIPSEIVLSYAGFLVSQGKVTFLGAVIAGTIGGTIAQLFLYWLGYYGGRPLVIKYGKYILINEKHLNIAEKWFREYGKGVIFAARFIPVVRHAISIPAGLAKMNAWQFSFYTVLAIIPWSIGFVLLGEQLGKNWHDVKEIVAPYMPIIIIVACILLGTYLLLKVMKNRRVF